MDNTNWRPAPNTRENIKTLADELNKVYNGFDGSIGRILDRKYHDRDAYAAIRNYRRQMLDLIERIDFMMMIQQGLEHKDFTELVLSGMLRAGDVLTSLDFLSEIEHSDAIRQIERKASNHESRRRNDSGQPLN